MKPGEFKRVLCFLSAGCVLFFFYLYWQQTTGTDTSRIIYSYRHTFNKQKKSHPPQWTWQCVNQRCERRIIKGAIPVVSLSTCSMLCGSTQLWPQPSGAVTLGSRGLTFNHQQLELQTLSAEPARSLLQQSFLAFNSNIISLVQNDDYVEKRTDVRRFVVKVSIEDSDIVRLKLDTKEGYTLNVKLKENEVVASIKAHNFFGARNGLETLSQLIWWDEYEQSGSLKVLKGASIQDSPVFPYRGIMLDTARNYMSVDSIRRVLDGMAANKLNVFHWHITDSQSFPLVSKRVPQLAKNGAYGPDMIYTPEDVRALVEFARVRGIRVVLEVDTPAHAGNGWTWGPQEGLGELAVCVNEKPWSLYCGEPPCGQLNPENPNVYDILEKIYKDLLEMSEEEEIFHLGGDEVNLECWAQHLQKSTNMNYTDLHDLWGEFTVKALKRLQAANGGKKVPVVILWSSNLSKRPYVLKYLDKKEVVVQSWGASQWPDTSDLVADGYRVIISHVDAWYLDCGFGKWRETGEAACDPYRPWQTVYGHRPWQQMRLERGLVLGGEACLWSEQFDDGGLDARLWPRAAAFAERVWSDPRLDVAAYSIPEDVYTRLNTHRSRLLARGLGVEALWPTWCVQNPGMCL